MLHLLSDNDRHNVLSSSTCVGSNFTFLLWWDTAVDATEEFLVDALELVGRLPEGVPLFVELVPPLPVLIVEGLPLCVCLLDISSIHLLNNA